MNNLRDIGWVFPLNKYLLETGGGIDWDDLMRDFPILYDMQLVMQSPFYHKEGDVLAHTKMTLDALMEDPYWQEREEPYRSALFLGALFHDVGKIKSTDEEEGKITSKGHSAKGARMIRMILSEFDDRGYNVPFKMREYVSNLALLHMLPVYFMEKKDCLRSVCASSWTCCNADLAALARADTNGRITEGNSDEALQIIGLFEEFCKEELCFDSPRPFSTEHSRFRYFFEGKGHPTIHLHPKYRGTVHLMSGLPGAGKDTHIADRLSNIPSVGLDNLREEFGITPLDDQGEICQEAKERCRQHMRAGCNFVFNATNFLKQTRGRWIRLFNEYDYRIIIHYIEPMFSILMEQNSNRKKRVPEGIVIDMYKKLEPPTPLECHELDLNVY